MIFKRLAVALAAVAMLALLAGPLGARTRKGDKLLREGQQAEARKQFDTALDLYEQALSTDPMDAAYQLAVNRVRFQAGQIHVTRGRRLRGAGNLEAAVVEFQKAFAIDPSSTIAEQELRQTNQMLDAEAKRKKQPGAEESKPEQRGISPTQAARRVAEERAAAMKGVAELRPLKDEITNLKIVNQNPKVLFETVGKLAGINVLFDSDFQMAGKSYSIDLARTNLTDALDYVALLTKSFWKPLSANTIFVTTDNVTKRRDYEEHVSRVFYLQNITSAQELQEVMTAVRQVTDVRKIFPVNSQSALIIRGTADQMALAEKVILDLDKPKPEVVVDVMVFETARTVTRDLGLLALSTGGINVPVNFTPQGAGTGTGTNATTPTIRLNELRSLSSGDFTVTLPGASLQALLSDGRTKILQSPQVRATDGQKATVKIGERFPYASGSFQSALGGVGGFPAAQTQFQFAEVGVNVDLTPRIHGSDEVSIQIMLEISNIRERINVGGVEQPVIGQRRVEHIIRVREGEATLIGGLMQAADRVSRSGIPGLMNIPGIGRFLSSEKVERSDNDLLVVLVPHVVRYPEILPENLKPIASGTETIYKVSYEPRGNGAAADPAPAPAPPAETAPAQPPTLPPSIFPPARPAEPAGTPAAPPPPPVEEQPQPPGISGAAAAEAPAAVQPVKVIIRPSSTEPMLNALVTVNVNIENARELFAAPMRLSFDPKVLRLIEVRRGPFMAGDGAQVTFEPTKLDDGAIISLNRVAGAGGMTGTGTLVTLLFQAIGRGSSPVAFSELTLRDAKLQNIEAEAAPATITVK